MRTAAVGAWLTGLAAAGTAVCAAFASGAAPASAALRAQEECLAGDGIGAADAVTYKLTVNGSSLDTAVLRAGDKLITDPSGSVDICLVTEGRTACRIGPNSEAQVVPSKGVILRISRAGAKRVSCVTVTGKPKKVKTPQATIILGDTRRTQATDRAAADPYASYEIIVDKAKTVVSVAQDSRSRVRVAKGDRVAVRMRVLPADQIVSWIVTVSSASGRSAPQPHSTLLGMLLTRDDLVRSNPDFVPALTPRGAGRLTTLQLCDGRRTLRAVEDLLYARHPDLFQTRGEAAAFVAEVVAGYAKR